MKHFLFFLLLVPKMVLGQCTEVDETQINLSDTKCYSGKIHVLNFKQGGKLVVKGLLEVDNINGVPDILVEGSGHLILHSSLNLNGGGKFINQWGIVLVQGSVEMQNGTNTLETYGKFDCNELQISSSGSTVRNCGWMGVINYTNFHDGSFELCDCGTLITGGLNVNKTILKGRGTITVTGGLNLNALLSSDPISFWYTGHINDPSKLGGVLLNQDSFCSKPVPVTYSKFEVLRSGNKVTVKIVFASVTKVNTITLQLAKNPSKDDSKVIKKILVLPSNIVLNKVYTATFTL